jgi:hypothetical protein
MTGSKQNINILSSPDGAEIKIYDSSNIMVLTSTTPTTVSLNKGKGFFSGASYRVEITKPGFDKVTVNLSPNVNGWYIAGNILLGGLIGWLIVDPATGGMWTLTPDNINQSLRQQVSLLNNNEGLMIVLKEQMRSEVFEQLKTVKIN